MSALIEGAARFAAAAHEGEKRKYTGEPYVNHCNAVAAAVQKAGADEATVAAAYLHDTIEDTKTSYEKLVDKFEVPNLVPAAASGVYDPRQMEKDVREVPEFEKTGKSVRL